MRHISPATRSCIADSGSPLERLVWRRRARKAKLEFYRYPRKQPCIPERAEEAHKPGRPRLTSHDHDHDLTHGHQHGPVLNPDARASWCSTFLPTKSQRPTAKWSRNYRKYAKIPGFRAGKVPESVVRRRFATEIRKEVIDSLLPERFNKGVPNWACARWASRR